MLNKRTDLVHNQAETIYQAQLGLTKVGEMRLWIFCLYTVGVIVSII